MMLLSQQQIWKGSGDTMKTRSNRLWPLSVLGGALLLAQAGPSLAQNVITPSGNGRFYVELKDASLADALEMVFKASGNTAYIIDEAAKTVNIGAVSFPGAAADAIVRQLANQNNFKVSKNKSGAFVIEPRAPIIPPSEWGMPDDLEMPGAPRQGAPRGVPANPFGVSLEENPQTKTIANAQFGARNTRNRNTRNSRFNREFNPKGEYSLVVIRHTYAGGIARLFSNGDVIPTELLVYPESALNSGGGLGGGGSVSGFGSGGRGGGMGGIGGMMGGFGGSSSGGIGGIGGIGGGSSSGGIFSDRNLKENVADIDNRAILDRVANLPIREWNYKQQDAKIRHIGPMAQDFAAAFGVGEDDRLISAVDANGVALAAIQALYAQTQEQSKQIEALQKQIAELQKTQSNSHTNSSAR